MERYQAKQKHKAAFKPVLEQVVKEATKRNTYKALHKHNMKFVLNELKQRQLLYDTQQELWAMTLGGPRANVTWADRQLGTERHQSLPRRHGPNVMYDMPKK